MPATRTILLTGCSNPAGIGFAAARLLARAGHHVLATVRDHAHDTELTGGLDGRLEVLDLDLLVGESIAAVARRADAEGVEVLVNNAGYGLIGTVEGTAIDQARANVETNLLGTMALVQALLPGLRARGGGHVINVSSIFVPGLCPPAIGFYAGTKAALETVCQALAVEEAPFGIRVTNLQPGPVQTDLERVYGSRTAADPRPEVVDRLYEWIAGGGPPPESAEDVAAALRAVIEADDPPLAAQTGAPGSEAYVAAAVRDPGRRAELAALRAAFPISPSAPRS